MDGRIAAMKATRPNDQSARTANRRVAGKKGRPAITRATNDESLATEILSNLEDTNTILERMLAQIDSNLDKIDSNLNNIDLRMSRLAMRDARTQ
jgi:hypothetical protein